MKQQAPGLQAPLPPVPRSQLHSRRCNVLQVTQHRLHVIEKRTLSAMATVSACAAFLAPLCSLAPCCYAQTFFTICPGCLRHSESCFTLHQLLAAAAAWLPLAAASLTPPCCLVVQNGTPTRWADEVDEESQQQEQQPPAAAAAAVDDSDDDGVCAAAALVVLHPLTAAGPCRTTFVPAGVAPFEIRHSHCCCPAGPPPGFEKPSARAAAADAADALAGSLKV